MTKKLNFKYYYIIIILFILFLIFEGLYFHYYTLISYYLEFLPNKNLGGYNIVIWSENGLVEFLQLIVLFISIIYFGSYFIKKREKNLNVICTFYLIGLIYYFFEEISWGQHIFFWSTPNFFLEVNSQNETNFHNTSNLFNELPRGLLLIWCSLSFLLIRCFKLNSKYINQFILPNHNLKFLSILILLFVIPDLLIKIINLNAIYLFVCFEKCIHDMKIYNMNIIPNLLIDIRPILTFNFIRLSELQELLLNLYIVTHAYYLRKLKK